MTENYEAKWVGFRRTPSNPRELRDFQKQPGLEERARIFLAAYNIFCIVKTPHRLHDVTPSEEKAVLCAEVSPVGVGSESLSLLGWPR